MKLALSVFFLALLSTTALAQSAADDVAAAAGGPGEGMWFAFVIG